MAGSIRTSPQFGSEANRIELIRKGLRGLFVEFDPEHVAIESWAYQGTRSETRNSITINRIVGIAEGLASAWESDVMLLDKNTVNRSLGLTGEVPKSRVRLMVESALKLKPRTLRNEHEVDAAALGFVAYQRIRRAA